jgi:hypothetical protein
MCLGGWLMVEPIPLRVCPKGVTTFLPAAKGFICETFCHGRQISLTPGACGKTISKVAGIIFDVSQLPSEVAAAPAASLPCTRICP